MGFSWVIVRLVRISSSGNRWWRRWTSRTGEELV